MLDDVLGIIGCGTRPVSGYPHCSLIGHAQRFIQKSGEQEFRKYFGSPFFDICISKSPI
jgi:hypothetical protein